MCGFDSHQAPNLTKMAYKDTEVRRQKIREHYQHNKQAYLEKNRKKEEENRAFIQAIKETTPCADCGKNYPYYVMEFDHRPGVDKYKEVSKLVGSSLVKIKEEIAKCDLVCANCHRERTHKRRVSSAEE